MICQQYFFIPFHKRPSSRRIFSYIFFFTLTYDTLECEDQHEYTVILDSIEITWPTNWRFSISKRWYLSKRLLIQFYGYVSYSRTYCDERLLKCVKCENKSSKMVYSYHIPNYVKKKLKTKVSSVILLRLYVSKTRTFDANNFHATPWCVILTICTRKNVETIIFRSHRIIFDRLYYVRSEIFYIVHNMRSIRVRCCTMWITILCFIRTQKARTKLSVSLDFDQSRYVIRARLWFPVIR